MKASFTNDFINQRVHQAISRGRTGHRVTTFRWTLEINTDENSPFMLRVDYEHRVPRDDGGYDYHTAWTVVTL